MTETQNLSPDHRAPLKPGEIRTHTVGRRMFVVMHVAGGSYTQASYRDTGGFATVIVTDRFEDAAVRAYADAIEQAESDAVDELDDADESSYISSSTGELVDPQAAPAQFAVVTRSSDRTKVLDTEGPMPLDEAMALADRAHAAGSIAQVDVEPADLSFNLPMGADMQLVTGERPTTAPSFADDVAALRNTLLFDEPFYGPAFRARLDRIAAQMPVRARVGDELWWMHSCGAAGLYYARDIAEVTCTKCDEPGEWQPLYTLGGA